MLNWKARGKKRINIIACCFYLRTIFRQSVLIFWVFDRCKYINSISLGIAKFRKSLTQVASLAYFFTLLLLYICSTIFSPSLSCANIINVRRLCEDGPSCNYKTTCWSLLGSYETDHTELYIRQRDAEKWLWVASVEWSLHCLIF